MGKFKTFINEDIFKSINEAYGQDLMGDYFKGKITLEKLIELAGGINKIATKKELEGFLKNKFMIGWKVEETGIPENKIVSKVKDLLKKF